MAFEILTGAISCGVAIMLFAAGESLIGFIFVMMTILFVARLWLILKRNREPLTLARKR